MHNKLSEERLREILDTARSYIGANGYDPDPEEIIALVEELLALRQIGDDGAGASLHEVQGSDGWIEWKGDKCPVPPETPVIVKLRGDVVPNNSEPENAGEFDWRHCIPPDDGTGYDIIAYRLVALPNPTADNGGEA